VTDEREILVAKGIRVRYDDRLVLDVERLALRTGEMLAVLGPNAAGKSTLMRVLAMLEKPTAGHSRFKGRAGRAAARALRKSSAAVFQKPHFWSDTVAYNVGLGLRMRGSSAREVSEHVERICGLMGIGDLLDRDVATLSGGQAQRVALARALVLKPDILFLDEPTANLDSVSRGEIREDIERIARQRAGSVLLITHDRAEAFSLADRVAVLVGGRLVQVGTPTELYENPADSYIARVTGAELTLKGHVLRLEDSTLVVDVGGIELRTVGSAGEGSQVKIAYRPEDLVLAAAEESSVHLSTRNFFFATVTEVRALGGLYRIRLKGPGGADMAAVVTRSAADELRLQAEGRVSVRVKATALHAFPAG
jgi:molybdopterin-binding protein